MNQNTVYYYQVDSKEDFDFFINYLIKNRPEIVWRQGKQLHEHNLYKTDNIVLHIKDSELGWLDPDDNYIDNKRYFNQSKENKKLCWDGNLIHPDGTPYLPYPFNNIYDF